MSEKLVVAVLGHQKSGKTQTWKELFGKVVRTGVHPRQLLLGGGAQVEVFLVSGSAEERKEAIEAIVPAKDPPIILCAIQYSAGAGRTIDYFVDHGYFLYVQWLNPGYSDAGPYSDSLGFVQRILGAKSLIGRRDGKVNAAERAEEIREFIKSWAAKRGFLRAVA